MGSFVTISFQPQIKSVNTGGRGTHSCRRLEVRLSLRTVEGVASGVFRLVGPVSRLVLGVSQGAARLFQVSAGIN